MGTITGSCLCDSVAFQLEADFYWLNLCHCKQCQRATGSAHASNLFTRTDNLHWTRGKDLVRRYDVPGRHISNAFCSNCGSGLPYVSASGRYLVVQAGVLNEPVGAIPDIRQIFCVERADWYDLAAAAEKHDGFPP